MVDCSSSDDRSPRLCCIARVRTLISVARLQARISECCTLSLILSLCNVKHVTSDANERYAKLTAKAPIFSAGVTCVCILHGALRCFESQKSLTLSPPIPLWLYALPYWSNPLFLIFDIRTLWRSVPSARASECQKLKIVG